MSIWAVDTKQQEPNRLKALIKGSPQRQISIAAIECTRGVLLSRHYPVVEIIPAVQGPKPKTLALIKIDAISWRKKTSWQ
jgi:hypothetical protein